MNFDEFDSRMRVYETAHDHCVLPGLHMVVRLDGRGFTRLTKERHDFERPFDRRFSDLMASTAEHLFHVGFRVVYAYTESDEISLVLHRDETLFGRKTRKIVSVLAGEASAHFSLGLGDMGCFDARVSQLPSVDLVVDYLCWRAADSHRNALSAHCYWALRREGVGAGDATQALSGLSASDKNELLFARGINFNDLPAWHRAGVGLYWGQVRKIGTDPRTGEQREVERRRLVVDRELPIKGRYAEFVRDIVSGSLAV